MKANDDILHRLRAEFLEMPDLRLTSEQVQRLCGIEAIACQSVLDSLVGMKFLSVTSQGVYARSTDGNMSRRCAARAGLGSPQRLGKAS
jgi:hypothetical protein